MEKRYIQVLPYDDSWPSEFMKIKTELETALGGLALRIEHVGSTSVPGLWAKPIIDIDAVIKSYDCLGAVCGRLEAIGYVHRGDLGVKGREAFKYQKKEHLMRHHLYVCPQDSPELRRHVALRDYLREHPEEAEEYSIVKRQAALLHPFDIDGYLAHKSAVIQDIYRKAGVAI
ncbi:MAG: GrpB family protein [Christensenellales bacterium]